jgi:hypothetical protein
MFVKHFQNTTTNALFQSKRGTTTTSYTSSTTQTMEKEMMKKAKVPYQTAKKTKIVNVKIFYSRKLN